ncbi:MAG: sodium-dependent transporter [Clostridia bacterium]|nr:sodium-dependent transporter [Clostridia bacterium]
MEKREKFSSRLGFILISAGCAIGLGNVWRFPYVVGQYGGAIFVGIYLAFLLLLGLPIMVMEFAVGRASQKSTAKSFDILEPKGSKWHIFSHITLVGNYLLMMFYTTVCGWMMSYIFKAASGALSGLDTIGAQAVFDGMLADPYKMMFWMALSVVLSFIVCSFGLQKGVERVTKAMMSALFVIILVLAIRAVTLPGAAEGLKFYLVPNAKSVKDAGLINVIFAAMGQAFFTLSIGMGSMSIFGSYIGKDRSLTGESLSICILDTLVAFSSGLIIFPACSAFGVDAGQGPGLVFATLPGIFDKMPFGSLWATLFFIFMTFAAMSTVIAIFENLISYCIDKWDISRKKAVLINGVLIIILSLPCVFGFNLLSGITPLGAGSTIQDLEDFIVSNNILPLGSLIFLLFCVSKRGWGWDNFIAEADCGKGLKFPKKLRFYVTYILPIIILSVFVMGYWNKFMA